MLDDGLNLVGLDLSDGFLIVRQDAGVRGIAGDTAELLDLGEAFFLALAAFDSTALSSLLQALEHPTSSECLGGGSFRRRLVDFFPSVGS